MRHFNINVREIGKPAEVMKTYFSRIIAQFFNVV